MLAALLVSPPADRIRQQLSKSSSAGRLAAWDALAKRASFRESVGLGACALLVCVAVQSLRRGAVARGELRRFARALLPAHVSATAKSESLAPPVRTVGLRARGSRWHSVHPVEKTMVAGAEAYQIFD